MRRTAAVLILPIVLTTLALATNPPDIQWQRVCDYRQGGASDCYNVELTADGGFVLAGWAFGFGGDSITDSCTAVYMVKTDSQGNIAWERDWPNWLDVKARSVQQTADGGFILYGEGSAALEDAPWVPQPYLLKTDSVGNLTWRRVCVPDSYMFGFCVRQLPDHGYILSALRPGSDSSLWLIRTDSSGLTQWQRTYAVAQGVWNGTAVPIVLAPNGGYVVGTKGLLKIDSLGSVEWYRTYVQVDEVRSARPTSDGGYVATGTGFYGSPSQPDSLSLFLFKTDASGNLVWGRDIAGRDSRGGQSVELTSDGGYIVAGTVTPPPRYDIGLLTSDVFGAVIRTDSLGNVLWSKSLPVPSGTSCIRRTASGGYAVGGFYSSSEEGMRMTLWKFAPEEE